LGNSLLLTEGWLASRLVADIIYFGDTEKGLEIAVNAFKKGKKPITELSGNDIVVVWKDADIEKTSASLLECFLGSTQICMVPKIGLIHEGIFEQFKTYFLERVKALKPGLPSESDIILSPVAKIKEFSEFLEDALSKGAKLIIGGERLNLNGKSDSNGIFIQPTLLEIDDCHKAMEMRCIKEEIFFPLLPLIKFSGNDETIFKQMTAFVNAHAYGLRVSLWISSPRYLRKFTKYVDNCGLFRINLRHIGFSYFLSTHGGTRKSGGPFGEMNYFWQKTSHLQGISRSEVKRR
jgi:acyl-CoA reductase-like NAD-dependent aldehyde dehydrogenase